MKRIVRLLLSLVFCILPLCAAPASATLRVISLYPGHTDNIAALGAAESIVAISHNDDLESLQDRPRLPANVTPEALLAHRPDVVVMRTLNERANPHLAAVLTKAGVAVHVLEPPSWEGFETYLAELAEILGIAPDEGFARLERIRQGAEQAGIAGRGNVTAPRVFLEATGKEIHTCSPGSWAARVIALCGGVNAAADARPIRPGSPLAPWGVERAVMLADQGLDIYLVQQGAMNASTKPDVLARPWFAAFGNVRLAFIEERCLSRPSLAGLERGTALLLAILYPQTTGETKP